MAFLLRREPFGSILDDVLSDYFTRSTWPLAAGTTARPGHQNTAPVLARLDVVDKGEKYAVTVDLPGIRKEDIRVTVEGARVAIAAEKKTGSEASNGEKNLLVERNASGFARSFELPVEVTDENADASFENGVLHLTLPKRGHVAGRPLTIR
jgi:HSP20 family protein